MSTVNTQDHDNFRCRYIEMHEVTNVFNQDHENFRCHYIDMPETTTVYCQVCSNLMSLCSKA